MKKWMGILVVLLAASIYMIWPKASIDRPIVVSAQVDESAKTMTISYITTKKDQTYLMEVAVDGKGFYPARTNGTWDGETETTEELASQNGYQLREDVIQLTEKELKHFNQYTGNVLLTDISYDGYAPIETLLILLREDEAAEGIIEKDDSLHYTFTAPEEMTIATIGHYDSLATLSYSRNGSELKLPVEMKKGDKIDISFHVPYKLSSKDELLVEIETTEEKRYTRHLEETIQLPAGYLKRIVANHQ